jgi:predicted nucleic acid-binding protein
MIVASAELLGAVLVTRDERLQQHAGVHTLWR